MVEKQTLKSGVLLRVAGVIRLGESTAFFRQTLERALEDPTYDSLESATAGDFA